MMEVRFSSRGSCSRTKFVRSSFSCLCSALESTCARTKMSGAADGYSWGRWHTISATLCGETGKCAVRIRLCLQHWEFLKTKSSFVPRSSTTIVWWNFSETDNSMNPSNTPGQGRLLHETQQWGDYTPRFTKRRAFDLCHLSPNLHLKLQAPKYLQNVLSSLACHCISFCYFLVCVSFFMVWWTNINCLTSKGIKYFCLELRLQWTEFV